MDLISRRHFAAKCVCLLLAALPIWSCRNFAVTQDFHGDSSSENWLQFGGQPDRINYHKKTTAPPLENLWTYKASSAVGPTLVVVDSVLYFATLDGRFEALDANTGRRIGKGSRKGHHEVTCAFYDGHLILASRYGDETLANYDLREGKYVWRIDAGDIASEPLIVDDNIYISALYSHIDKYDFKSGEKLWTYQTEDQHRSSPAVSNNYLVIGCDDGTLYSLDAQHGSLLWKFQTGASIFATPIIWNETVLVGSADSIFYALNSRNGAVLWTFDAQKPIYQAAATDGQNVLFGTSDGSFYCLDIGNGEERWKFEAQSVVSTAPTISGRVVYFGSLDRRYYCLSVATGKELWRFEAKGRIRTTPVVWGNYLFGASEDKYIYAFKQNDVLGVN